MKLAIMQPYFMPYIGYFQLIKSVDKFIFYDDVTFIKQGWINRNQVLINNKAKMFSIPLGNASSNVLIKDVEISSNGYDKWKKSFLNTLTFSYGKAKKYNKVYALIQNILQDKPNKISDLSIKSIMEVSNYLGLDTNFEVCSNFYSNNNLSGQNRVLDICLNENAKTYINPIGGMQLYSKDVFIEKNIELFFIETIKSEYMQLSGDFVPFLSIIDILMFNDVEEIHHQLDNYILI